MSKWKLDVTWGYGKVNKTIKRKEEEKESSRENFSFPMHQCSLVSTALLFNLYIYI